jgi:indolepyruvate ferredoxin oxidoreductase beta subunit
LKLDIVFTGIGGQGIIASSDILCEAALIDGFDVTKAETHGMAQRGGTIVTHVRIGDEVSSPLIERGTSDVIIGFEILETARILPMLKPSGTVVMNKKSIPPYTQTSNQTKLITNEKLVTLIREKALKIYEIDGTNIADKIGNNIVVNIVILGAFSVIQENPIKKTSLKRAISNRMKKDYIEINLKAFQLGRDSLVNIKRTFKRVRPKNKYT